MTGRPTKYTKTLAKKICEEIVGGRSIADIASDEDMPCKKTIFNWLHTNKGDFLHQYARAKRIQGFVLDEAQLEMILDPDSYTAKTKITDIDSGEIVERLDSASVQLFRAQLQGLQALAARMRPKAYQEEVEGEEENNVTINLTLNAPTESESLAETD